MNAFVFFRSMQRILRGGVALPSKSITCRHAVMITLAKTVSTPRIDANTRMPTNRKESWWDQKGTLMSSEKCSTAIVTICVTGS